MKGVRSHEEATINSLRGNPVLAAEYLNAVLEDGDQKELMVALRRVVIAYGGVAELAEASDLNATTLYRTLSARGNPEIRSLSSILRALGLRIAIQPILATTTTSERATEDFMKGVEDLPVQERALLSPGSRSSHPGRAKNE